MNQFFTKFYQAHILPEKFNIDKRKVHLSALIRTNQITRNEALKKLDEPLYDEDEFSRDLKFVCKKLDFTENEFKEILDSDPVSHLSFNSDRKFIEPLLSMAKYFGMSTFK